MNPRITVLAGLPEKETVDLILENGESFTLGRGTECDLSLGNAAVSRRHCRITRAEENFRLEDLESHNGTFVNDLPVKSRLLKHGDRINLGNSHVMFLTDENLPGIQAEFDDGSMVLNSTVRLFRHFETEELSADLNTLVKLGKALNKLKDAESLKRRFLEIILEFIPARRGAIILTDEDFSNPQSTCVSAGNASDTETMQISRTVCRKVLTEQAALSYSNLSDSPLSASESLIATRVSSVLCVPFKRGAEKGLIYLDSADAGFRFTDNHLEQITALSFLIDAALNGFESIENLRRENAVLKADLKIETSIIGESQAVQDVFELISKVAPTDSNVLITGESGTGKELAARAIYQNSARRRKPFAAINCAALNENLLESELFGYEKGSFTGAIAQKKGKLEAAEGGTIFLDEIAELSPNFQAKLLRVVQEREFERVGGTKAVKVDVRLIAATNRNLEAEVKKGAFREDLFFRLNVVQIKMPALRERKSDIPLLTQHFVKKYSEKCHRRVVGLSEKAQQILLEYDWQGNVRELENVIERAIVLGSTETILPQDFPADITGNQIPKNEITGETAADESSEPDEIMDFQEQLKFAKQKIILTALKKSDGNYTKAARGLGIDPTNLHRMVRIMGIKEVNSE